MIIVPPPKKKKKKGTKGKKKDFSDDWNTVECKFQRVDIK